MNEWTVPTSSLSLKPAKSDIYIIPKIDRIFINPFSKISTIDILCEYMDQNGRPLDVAPQNVLARAEEQLRLSTGISLKAMAELEFYLIVKKQAATLFPGAQDKNYHESAPFTLFEDLRSEVLTKLADVGIATKYGHSEVGRILAKDGTLMEQHEIEFVPNSLRDMAETIAVAKWAVRNVCATNGMSVSFSPKIALEHAGNGMHVHLCGLKNGKSVVANSDGTLSIEALKMIGGILQFASSLAAFGNPAPVSYLRFKARRESPMHVYWSARYRLALVRIPLWWSFREGYAEHGNCKETFEYRGPDALANPFLLFAGITVAVNFGLSNSEKALKIAEDLHVASSGGRRRRLKALPRSCNEASKSLRKDRRFYEASDVFPKILINEAIQKLKAYKDKDLWKSLADKPEKLENVLKQYLHCG